MCTFAYLGLKKKKKKDNIFIFFTDCLSQIQSEQDLSKRGS